MCDAAPKIMLKTNVNNRDFLKIFIMIIRTYICIKKIPEHEKPIRLTYSGTTYCLNCRKFSHRYSHCKLLCKN